MFCQRLVSGRLEDVTAKCAARVPAGGAGSPGRGAQRKTWHWGSKENAAFYLLLSPNARQHIIRTNVCCDYLCMQDDILLYLFYVVSRKING